MTSLPSLPTTSARAPIHNHGDAMRMAELIDSAKPDKVALVSAMIDQGFSLSRTIKTGLNTLQYAAFAGSRPICELLVARGADINASSTSGKPLEIAVSRILESTRALSVCDFLLDAGADNNALHAIVSTLWRAKFGGATNNDCRPELLTLLRLVLAQGAKPSYLPAGAGPTSLTPFQQAVNYGVVDAVKIMIDEAGESLDQESSDGRTLIALSTSKEMTTFLRAAATAIAVSCSVAEGSTDTPANASSRARPSPSPL